MNRCEAVVVAIHGAEAEVEVAERAQACGSCKSADGCHTGLLGLSAGVRRYRVVNTMGARRGERVSLQVAEGMLLRTSLVTYLVPAVLAIVGAVIGQTFAGDPAALAGTLLGLILGLIALRRSEHLARRRGSLLLLHPLSAEVHFFKESS